MSVVSNVGDVRSDEIPDAHGCKGSLDFEYYNNSDNCKTLKIWR